MAGDHDNSHVAMTPHCPEEASERVEGIEWRCPFAAV